MHVSDSDQRLVRETVVSYPYPSFAGSMWSNSGPMRVDAVISHTGLDTIPDRDGGTDGPK